APYFAPPPQRPFAQEVGAVPGRQRIGLVTRNAAGEAVDPECERAVRDAARLLESLGHSVEETSLASIEAGFGPAFRVVVAGNQRMAIETYAQKIGRSPGQDDLEKITRLFFESGAQNSAAEYARAVVALHRIGRQVAKLFETFDLVLTPTLPRP